MPDDNAQRLASKANELYWHTGRPVGRLADELGISRSKFYALIHPLQLDVACPTCGAPLAVGSRSDREAGRARCTGCGTAIQLANDKIAPRPTTTPRKAPARAATPSPPPAGPHRLELPGGAEIWLSALAGLAAGLLVGAFWRRR